MALIAKDQHLLTDTPALKGALTTVIGLKSTLVARAMACLRSATYRDVFARYVRSSAGRASFEWSAAERMVNSKLESVSSNYGLSCEALIKATIHLTCVRSSTQN